MALESDCCVFEISVGESELDRVILEPDDDLKHCVAGRVCILFCPDTLATIVSDRIGIQLSSDLQEVRLLNRTKGLLLHNFPQNTAQLLDLDCIGVNVDIVINVFDMREKTTEALKLVLEEFKARDTLFNLRCEVAQAHTKTTEKIVEIMCHPDRFLHPATAFSKLALRLSLAPIDHTATADALRPLACAFRNAAAADNISKRTGAMRRFVYLATQNSLKLHEFVQVFDRYGVEVLQLPPAACDAPALLTALLCESTKELVAVAVLREESALLKPGTAILSTRRSGAHADHRSVLQAWTLNGGPRASKEAADVRCQQYTHVTRGHIRAAGSNAGVFSGGAVFGWDDEFVLLATGRTYQEHLRTGLKVSSRNMVISSFLEDHIYYKHLRGLNYADLSLARPVDFDADVAAFVRGQPHYNSQLARDFGLCDMLTRVLNEGIFFKCAETRVEANYWQPGLNAGIPLTAKKDPVHEKTFMFHDFGHFLMKDLIFTGRDSALHRSVYIASRMISEAVTIMLADGVFVDTLRRGGVDYDFSTRCIYPLFLDTGLDFSQPATFVANLRALTKASVDYTVKGDDSGFRRLLAANGRGEGALDAYKAKYKPFFVSDYQWTAHNYANMAGRAEEMRRWWAITAPVRELLDLPLETIDEFITTMPAEPVTGKDPAGAGVDVAGDSWQGIVDRVFDCMFDRRVGPVFQPVAAATTPCVDGAEAAGAKPPRVSLDDKSKRLRRGFLRYMIGQMGVFARYGSVPEAGQYLDVVNGLLQGDAPVAQVRGAYEEFLELLHSRNLISTDDLHNFREVYPLFEPFYVSYDKNEEYPDLAALARKILDPAAHRHHQVVLVEKFMGRPVSAAERRCHDLIASIVEAGGGQVEDGAFVTSLGVTLLAVGTAPSSAGEQQAWFLIAGAAHETVLDLLNAAATTPGAIASLLGGSGTPGTALPLFRISSGGSAGATGVDGLASSAAGGAAPWAGGGSAARGAMAYLRAVQTGRTAFEALEQPRVRWGPGGAEAFDATQPACRATAFVYVLAPSALHGLVSRYRVATALGAGSVAAGVAITGGSDAAEVVGRMAEEIRDLWPDSLADPSVGMSEVSSRSGGRLGAAGDGSTSAGGVASVGGTAVVRLTAQGRRLLATVGVGPGSDDGERLQEFCSRVTSLDFPVHVP